MSECSTDRLRRQRLNNRRASENFEFPFGGVMVSVSLGYYQDGRIGEVFLSTRKAGTAIDIACRDIAVLLSLAIQHGTPIETIKGALTKNANGQCEGLAGVLFDEIERRAKS